MKKDGLLELSEELKDKMKGMGLTQQQVDAIGARAVYTELVDNPDAQLAEQQNQITEAQIKYDLLNHKIQRANDELLEGYKQKFLETSKRLDGITETLIAITKSQREYGNATDERVKNAIILYASMVSIGLKSGGSASEVITGAGYATYAFLGGQARRDVEYRDWSTDKSKPCECDNSNDSDGWEDWDEEKTTNDGLFDWERKRIIIR